MQSQLIIHLRWLLLSALLLSACSTQSPHRQPTGWHTPQAMEYAQPRQHTTASMPSGHGGSHKTGKPYRVAGQWYYPLQSASAYDESGIASWYGRDFHGRKTANGERYDMHALSAAHKTLPLPTLVRVTNLDNGRSIIVRVNDRGPFVKGRLIDLSYAAARELGYTSQGTARVRVQTLDQSVPARASAKPPLQKAPPSLVPAAWAASHGPSKGSIFVQLGAFSSRVNAVQLRDRLSSSFSDIVIQPRQVATETLYRVRIGPFEDMQKIEQTVQQLQNIGYDNAVVVIE